MTNLLEPDDGHLAQARILNILYSYSDSKTSSILYQRILHEQYMHVTSYISYVNIVYSSK
jgi:hypothetical protein